MWPRKQKPIPKRNETVGDELEDRVAALENYNLRLAELAGVLTQKLKEFSTDEYHAGDTGPQR